MNTHQLSVSFPARAETLEYDTGTLEYDPANRWLIWTERLGPDEYGAAAIVARDVPEWLWHKLLSGF